MTVHIFLLNSQEKLWSMIRNVLKNKPGVDVVKLKKSGGVVSRNAKFRQKSIRVSINMLPFNPCYLFFLKKRLMCADISNGSISMALQMISAHILISRILVTLLSFGLVAATGPTFSFANWCRACCGPYKIGACEY